MYIILFLERKIEFSIGEFYHLYNRGVEKREVFLEARDYERFMKLLYLSNGTKPFVFRDIQNKIIDSIERGDPLVAIGAYCLMPNHFHILVREITEGGISMFMEKLTTGYSKYFNTKHRRVGALFQGRFKAEHADNDEYLKYLFAYIHLNPIKLIDPLWKESGIRNTKKAKSYLENYHYSSYRDYIEKDHPEARILSKEEFPKYFKTMDEFKDFTNDWLEYQTEAYVDGRFSTKENNLSRTT